MRVFVCKRCAAWHYAEDCAPNGLDGHNQPICFNPAHVECFCTTYRARMFCIVHCAACIVSKANVCMCCSTGCCGSAPVDSLYPRRQLVLSRCHTACSASSIVGGCCLGSICSLMYDPKRTCCRSCIFFSHILPTSFASQVELNQ